MKHLINYLNRDIFHNYIKNFSVYNFIDSIFLFIIIFTFGYVVALTQFIELLSKFK